MFRASLLDELAIEPIRSDLLHLLESFSPIAGENAFAVIDQVLQWQNHSPVLKVLSKLSKDRVYGVLVDLAEVRNDDFPGQLEISLLFRRQASGIGFEHGGCRNDERFAGPLGK
jgi:hypothetical protein